MNKVLRTKMAVRVKKRDMAALIVGMILVSSLSLFINSKSASAACANVDTITLRIFDPNSVQIRSSATTIDPVTGSSDPCSSATVSSMGPLYTRCQISGSYTADVTCSGTCPAGAPHNGHVQSSTIIITCLASEKNKFLIKNNTGGNIAAFDEKGYVYLKGFNHSNQASLSPTANSYIIRNNTGKVVAYINSSGSLFITGNISMSQAAVSASMNSFVIRNGTRKDVAYIDSSGNLVLSGKIYFNWTDPI